MTDVSNLASIVGAGNLDTWFVPTMFKAIELDNSFVLWSRHDSEYFIDTTNQLLKIKYFIIDSNNNKNYISNNSADVYIDGADIRSVAGKYL